MLSKLTLGYLCGLTAASFPNHFPHVIEPLLTFVSQTLLITENQGVPLSQQHCLGGVGVGKKNISNLPKAFGNTDALFTHPLPLPGGESVAFGDTV